MSITPPPNPLYPLSWSWKKGTDLSIEDLYTILALRQEVFVVEQHCVYLDADGHDFEGYHLLGLDQNQGLTAYLRVYQSKTGIWKLGRVLVIESARHLKIGSNLVRQALFHLAKSVGLDTHPHLSIKVDLHAQAHLQAFYEELGWPLDGDAFDEAGILHVPMTQSLSYQNRPAFHPSNIELNPVLLPPPAFSVAPPHLIFDLDGTLIDSSEDYALCFEQLASEFNRPPPSKEEVKSLMYAGLAAQFDACIGPRSEAFHYQVLIRFREICLEHELQYTALYPQVSELLQTLKERGVQMHICTNRPQDLCLDVLDRLGIRSFFDICIGGDEGVERKPDPAMLIAVLKRLSIPPSQALFVGDSVVDLSAGSRAGLATLGVDWGYTPSSILKAHQPSSFLYTPLDLLDLFPST